MNLPIIFALLVMGFTFTITQVMVIRELLVVFAGNELSIAIILSNWLLLEAAGSYLIGRKVQEFGWGRSSYALVQVVLSLFLPITIY
ncbi:MAG: spermine synthase, partial [Deltaproteobacteria bacterium]|nr:spermine synthase [Deltaproteobacteria bacterium]